MKKVITKIVFFIFFLNKSILNSQIPTELNHLSNIIAKRLAACAEVDLNYFDQNHISSVDLNKLFGNENEALICLLYTSPSPRDYAASRMPSSA